MAGLRVLHGHVAGAVRREVNERVVTVLRARDFEMANARGRVHAAFRAVVLHQLYGGWGHDQHVFRLFCAHPRTGLHPSPGETDLRDPAALHFRGGLAQRLRDVGLEIFA